MPKVIVTAEVDDLKKWESGFRTHADLFRSMAVTTVNFATNAGNQVAVCTDTTNLDTFMKVFDSPATAESMKFDGVKRETVKVYVLDKELKL